MNPGGSGKAARNTQNVTIASAAAAEVLSEIELGKFADEWDAERDAGYPSLERLLPLVLDRVNSDQAHVRDTDVFARRGVRGGQR